jgi:hypothetical protein
LPGAPASSARARRPPRTGKCARRAGIDHEEGGEALDGDGRQAGPREVLQCRVWPFGDDSQRLITHDTGHLLQFLNGRCVDVYPRTFMLPRSLEAQEPEQELLVPRRTVGSNRRSEQEREGDADAAGGRDESSGQWRVHAELRYGGPSPRLRQDAGQASRGGRGEDEAQLMPGHGAASLVRGGASPPGEHRTLGDLDLGSGRND